MRDRRLLGLQAYHAACHAFAEATCDWGDLEHRFYTTALYGEIAGVVDETPDNAHGGMDVSWAFHLAPDEIDRQVAERYVDEVRLRREAEAEAENNA